MVDYKEILRLSHNGYSLRQIAASTAHSHHTVAPVFFVNSIVIFPTESGIALFPFSVHSVRKYSYTDG